MATKKKNQPKVQTPPKTVTAKPTPKATRSKSATRKEPFLATADIIPLLLIVIYLCVDFLPFFGSADIMGPQWMYIVIVNMVSAAYMVFNKQVSGAVYGLSKNLLVIFYSALFVLAGISIFGALDKVESIICYGRMSATFFAFCNMAILLYNRTHLFKIVAQILAVILFFESIDILSQFFKALGEQPLDQVIYDLKGNSGNKNIMAASMVVKIPFAAYCLYSFKPIGKAFNMIAIALGALSIFFINARSAFLGLILLTLVYIAFCVYQHFKERDSKQTAFRIGYLLLPVLLSFFVSGAVLRNEVNSEKLEGKQSTYGTVTDRLESITAGMGSASLRMKQVMSAVDYIMGGTGKIYNRFSKEAAQDSLNTIHLHHNPLMGAGIGNWKLVSIPYERSFSDEMFITYHVHNDFLETTAELGIVGGLLFFGLFICMAVFSTKTLLSKETSPKNKTAAVFSLMALGAYFTDAAFNFPSERPIMQIFFALILACNVNAFLSGRKEVTTPSDTPAKQPVNKKWLRPAFVAATFLFMIPATYTTYNNYKSMVGQALYNADMLSGTPVHHSWEVIPMLPEIPDLNVFGFPIDAIKARYLFADKKYDSSLYYLNRSMNVNPYISYNEFMKGNIFFEMKKYDSAFFWAQKCFYMKPRAKSNYRLLMAIIINQKKDSVLATKYFKDARLYREEPWIWSDYINAMAASGSKDYKHLYLLSDSAFKMFSGNTTPEYNDVKNQHQQLERLKDMPVQQ